MKASFLVSLSIAMFVLATPAPAQETSRDIKIDEKAMISLPQGWHVRNQERDALTIYMPLRKPRTEQRDKEENEDEADAIKPQNVIESEVAVHVSIEHRRDHAEAVRRLAEIAVAYPEKASALIIGGWPAIERRRRDEIPQLGEEESEGDTVRTWFATTAIAVDATLYRLGIVLAPDADIKLLNQAQRVGRALRLPQGPIEVSRRELRDIERLSVRLRSAVPAPVGARKALQSPQSGSAVLVQSGVGEIEIATTDGQHVVMAANSGFSYSDDAGAHWTSGGAPPCKLTNLAKCDGDPSLAVGKSGAVYYSWIGGKTGAQNDGVSRSTDNGHTFAFSGFAAICPGKPGCKVPDQEHLAADRFWLSFLGQDRVYNVWRDLTTDPNTVRMSCSRDDGATWSAGVAVGEGDFGRVSVGGDAFVYIAYVDGGNMMLHKFSNCDWGLVPQVGWPITVSAYNKVACPEPGLDRCNGSNSLASPKVAVDDLNPQHVYYAFATSTNANNEDIMVFDSMDGGATFSRSVRVNAAVSAHRFMPWISTYGGIAVLGWYDRRYATAANDDLTRYFIGGAAVRGPKLQALAETDLSGIDDNQCSIWLTPPRNTKDSESCSTQPQNAGFCQLPKGSTGKSTNARCDFSTKNACTTAGESCQTGRGSPKYGDYNGNAAAAGLSFSAWTSSVPPESVGGASGKLRIYASTNRVPSDFYVRDWTATPAFFDDGTQPSTNPIYWTTSDVWNQSTNVANAPGPDGYVLGDAPNRAGSNFAFARVSRRAPAAASAPNASVKVTFYLTPFGFGAPYTSLGSETVTFGPADMMLTTPAHAWSVPAGAPSHLGLAVEIEAPDGDIFSEPSLSRTLKFASDRMRPDNNKAQRNLRETIGTSAGTEIVAFLGNEGQKRRTLKLRVDMPKDVTIDATLATVGGREPVKLMKDAIIETRMLAPGDNTWLTLHVNALPELKTPVPIHIFENTNPSGNGFSVVLSRPPIDVAVRRSLTDLAGVLQRLARLEKSDAFKTLASKALDVAKGGDASAFIAFHADAAQALSGAATRQQRRADGDPFMLDETLKRLAAAVKAKDNEAAIAASIAFTERLDATLTLIMRNRGIGAGDLVMGIR